MSPVEIKNAILNLSPEEKRSLILDMLPEVAGEAVRDADFMMRLFPVMLEALQESGIDLQQLLRFAGAMNLDSPRKAGNN